MIGGNVSKLRKRSNAFVQNLNNHIADVVDSSKDLIKLNQKQLKESKKVNGQSITPLYSPAYAKRKGYKKPDGYLTGEMYREMDIIANETNNSWFITSFADHTKYFVERYGDVFGIGKANQQSAFKITVPKLKQLYQKLVLN